MNTSATFPGYIHREMTKGEREKERKNHRASEILSLSDIGVWKRGVISSSDLASGARGALAHKLVHFVRHHEAMQQKRCKDSEKDRKIQERIERYRKNGKKDTEARESKR